MLTLVYFWLSSPELALERVINRVKAGGHNIPEEVIYRRYGSGMKNLLRIYIPISDYWMIIDNSRPPLKLIAEGSKNDRIDVIDRDVFNKISSL